MMYTCVCACLLCNQSIESLLFLRNSRERDAHHPLLLPTGPATKSAIYPSQQRKRAKAICGSCAWFRLYSCCIPTTRESSLRRGGERVCVAVPERHAPSALPFFSIASIATTEARPPPSSSTTHTCRPLSSARIKRAGALGRRQWAKYHVELISCADG